MKTPIALTIAGSDSGGGAGIQADLKTFSALGVYGASVITALTAQNTREVRGIFDVPPEFVRQQIDTVFEDIAVDAVKVGMLSRPEVIEAVAQGLDRQGAARLVVDPVMVAKSGDALLQPTAVTALREQLLPRALIITPNLPETAVLLERSAPETELEMIAAAEALLRLGAKAVLVKGGHLDSADSLDILHDGSAITRLTAARVATGNTHGTGCTLSSAIAAFLARGSTLPQAVQRAKDYLNGAIGAADTLQIGGGHGPVHHFHGLWPAAKA